MSKMRLEYHLWCPLTETFAPNPFGTSHHPDGILPGDVSNFPNNVTKNIEKKCVDSRNKQRKELLGFIPNSSKVDTLGVRKKNNSDFLRELSSAMNQIYLEEYAVSDAVWKRREKVRATVERVVAESGEFPQGTRVSVFGSSANGFG